MGPGVGAQRGGGLCQEDVIMTALATLESRHPRLGQSLWWLWVMRPRCLHAHAAPAGVFVCVCVCVCVCACMRACVRACAWYHCWRPNCLALVLGG